MKRSAATDLAQIHRLAAQNRRQFERFAMPIVSNGGFDQGRAEEWVGGGRCDAVAFGRAFFSNPDLLERFRLGAPLNVPDTTTFYEGGERGYIDYAALSQ